MGRAAGYSVVGLTKSAGLKSRSRFSSRRRQRRRKNAVIIARTASPIIAPATLPTMTPVLTPWLGEAVVLAEAIELGRLVEKVFGTDSCVCVTAGAVGVATTRLGEVVLSVGIVVTEDAVLDEVDVGDDVESLEDEVVVTAVELCEVALGDLCVFEEVASVEVMELEEVDVPVESVPIVVEVEVVVSLEPLLEPSGFIWRLRRRWEAIRLLRVMIRPGLSSICRIF